MVFKQLAAEKLHNRVKNSKLSLRIPL